jgi:hypothetical protein
LAYRKRHHYLPVFYLKGFIDPDQSPFLWIYGKDKEEIIKTNVANIAVRGDYYTFRTSEGTKDSDKIESFLSAIEGYCAPVIQKIRRRELLNDEDRIHFAVFLAFMYVRVPSFRENIEEAMKGFIKSFSKFMASHKEGFEATVKSMERDTGKEIGMPTEELRKFMLEGEYDVKVVPEVSLMGIAMAQDFAKIFLHMQWFFFGATRDYKFVTSDNPLSIYDPTYVPSSFYGIGLLNKKIEIVFPVSSNIACLGIWKENPSYPDLRGGLFHVGNNKIVKALVKRTVHSAYQYVFASQRSQVFHAFVKKHIGRDRIIMRMS